MKNFKEERPFRSLPKILFPNAIQKLSSTIAVRKVVPFTSKLNGNVISSLLISCKSGDLDYQKIAGKGLNPNTRFRMYNIQNQDHCIEIELIFEGINTFKMHLDPSNFLVKEYLKAASKYGIIGFHFIIEGNPNIINLFTEIDLEETDWFSRNHKISSQIGFNLGYKILSEYVEENKMDRNREILFSFYEIHDKELLIDHTTDRFLYE